MNKNIYSVVILCFFVFFTTSCSNNKSKTSENNQNQELIDNAVEKDLQGKITIQADPILMKISSIWAKNFSNTYPTVLYEITENISENSIKSLHLENSSTNIVFSSSLPTEAQTNKGLLSFKICTDAILPVFNTSNAGIQYLVRWGVSIEVMKKIISGTTSYHWNDIQKECKNEPVALFFANEKSSLNKTITSFFNIKNTELKGKNLSSEKEVKEVVSTNHLALGFMSSSLVFNSSTGYKERNLYVLPIDFNNDGLINDDEHIYDNLEAFNTAVKEEFYYPELTRNLYIIINKNNESTIVKEFLRWIYSTGQNFITETSFIPLTQNEIKLETKKIPK
jgi:phosphate transport system substrate-binding protein